MIEKTERTEQAVLAQNSEIEIFRHNEPQQIADMVVGEAQELQQAIREAFVTDDLTEVASEIGDVFYLMIRLCDELGIDWRDATMMKVFRNKDKYGGQNSQLEAKKKWQEQGGDGIWFRAYLDNIAQE